jgi:hypothetical protein
LLGSQSQSETGTEIAAIGAYLLYK